MNDQAIKATLPESAEAFPPQIDERGGVRFIVDQQDARAADRAPRPGWELQRRHPEVGGGELTGAKKAPRQGGDLDRGADGRAQHMRRLGAPPDKHEQHRIVPAKPAGRRGGQSRAAWRRGPQSHRLAA